MTNNKQFQQISKEMIQSNTLAKSSNQTDNKESLNPEIKIIHLALISNKDGIIQNLGSHSQGSQIQEEYQCSLSIKYWRSAEDLLEHNKLQEAILMAQKCIEYDPEIQDEFIGLGCIQDRIGHHYGDLFEWYCLMKEQYNSNSSPYDILCLCLSVNTQSYFNQYLSWYKEKIRINPNNYKLWFGLATLHYNKKEFKEAEQAFTTVIKYNPTCSQAYLKIAFIHCFKWYKDNEAVQWARKAQAINQSNYYAKLIIALCLKDIPQRIEMFKSLIERVPDYARPYNGLGNAYLNLKNYEEAILWYKKCISVNNKYEHPYYGLGSIYSQLGNYDKSIKWYKRCIEVCPSYDFPYYGLGIAFSNKNDVNGAIYWFNECIRINPHYDCPYYALGNIHKNGKQYHKAIKFYQNSLQLKPIDPLCFSNLGQCYLSICQYQLALQCFEKMQLYKNLDKTMSPGNIEYVNQTIDKFLNEKLRHQKSPFGYITLKEKIQLNRHVKQFQVQLRKMLTDQLLIRDTYY